MPELPEVETISIRLRQGSGACPGLLGRTVGAVHLYWQKSLANSTEAELRSRLTGQTLQEIQRRGKYLLFHFDPDWLLFHLRMSGDLFSDSADPAHSSPSLTPLQPKVHTRFVLEFEDGTQMVFVDPRKFGRLWLTSDPAEITGSLGPEPFDSGLTPEIFCQKLHEHNRQLKPLLLDQTFLAGLGNIYTDESLYLARLNPLQPSGGVTLNQAGILLEAIRVVLKTGIQHDGASIDWVYRNGNFQNHFQVYQRTGKPCLVCGTKIERIIVGQRSTHFCSACQKIVNGS
jgi:formamidopyrimidine-DNA glycosylase